MKNKIFIHLIVCSAFIILSCSKEDIVSPNLTQGEQDSDLSATDLHGKLKLKLISGVGFFAEDDECDAPGQGADYAIRMTGDLEGCVYVFIEKFKCFGNGIYLEKGREYFVGTYKGKSGSFWTTYNFEAKYEGCGKDGSYSGAEIFGRCQHPLVKGSGEGVFKGVTGRYNMIDNVQNGSFPYRGHLKF